MEGKNKRKYRWEEIKQHKRRGDCWLLIDNKVYDVSQFQHPGGWVVLVRAAKDDATEAFAQVEGHASAKAEEMMTSLYIGDLAEEAEEAEEEGVDLKSKEKVTFDMETPQHFDSDIEQSIISPKTFFLFLIIIIAIGITIYFMLRK